MAESSEDGFFDMENSSVIDIDGSNLGKIIDFTIDSEFKLQHFIIEGSNKAVKSVLGSETQYKLLLPHEKVRRTLKQKVYISDSASDLDTIDKISSGEVKFSNLKLADVLAVDHEFVGKVADAIFHKDHHISLILGGSTFDEFLKKVGIKQKLNLILPFRYIKRLDSNIIVMNKGKEFLREVFDGIDLDTSTLRKIDARKLASRESRMVLYKEDFMDVLMAKGKDTY